VLRRRSLVGRVWPRGRASPRRSCPDAPRCGRRPDRPARRMRSLFRIEWLSPGRARAQRSHFCQVFRHPRLLLPGHPLDPCRALRGAAPVESATHSPDGCGLSDRLSACHDAVASPSQSRTASATALHWVGRTPLAIYPGADRRAARRHAELHLRRPAEEPAQASRQAMLFPHRAPLAGAARRAGLSAKTCSRLSGPSRLGSSESSWASGRPVTSPLAFRHLLVVLCEQTQAGLPRRTSSPRKRSPRWLVGSGIAYPALS
jgi:hypothetical protein